MIVPRSVTDSVCTRALPLGKFVPKCTKIDLRVSKIQNFLGGGMSPDSLSRCRFARTAPGLLSAILDRPLSRTTRKLPLLPLLRDRVKNPNHLFLSATDSLAQDNIGPHFLRKQETVFYELLKERMEDKIISACYCYL